VLATLGMVAFGAAVALIVSAALKSQTPAGWLWLLGAGGIGIRLAANLGRDRLAQALSARIRKDMRAQLIHKASLLGPQRLARHGNTAWWANQFLEQVDALHGYLARYLPARQTALITPALIIIITFGVDWLAGILLLLATPIIPVFMVLIGWGTEAVHRTQQAQQASLAANLMDNLQALPWLRRMGATTQARHKIQTDAQDYRRVSMRVLRVAFLSSAALEFFSAVSIGLMAIYIGFALLGLVSFGPAAGMTLGAGLFILMLAPECFLPLRQLAQAHHDMNAARASAAALCELENVFEQASLQTPNEIPADPQADTAVRLIDVSLTHHDAQQPVLTTINLAVARGEVLGIAGNSGQGKSSLLYLVAGFVSPTGGHIARDQSWAWLEQRPHLFHGSLRENLALASPHQQTDAQLIQALAQVGLPLPNPLLPAGLDTQIGETNQGVSGGQAQRIALARALLSGATLWLLDEPTAALDDQTRDSLLQTVMQQARARGITIVMASHDPVALAQCDRVMVLDQGVSKERA
jgi:ATP-binding cassette subfamily C protein CydD